MTTEELIKQVWPGWEIDKQIGRGAYGNVYKVYKNENSLELTAAVKVISIPFDSWEIEDLKTEGLDEEETGKYLENIVNNVINEIKILISLRASSNIVRIEDYSVVPKENEVGWTILIRMELLTPLSVFICDKTLSREDVIKLGIDVLDSLTLCEENKIIHRDIKPENIFVNEFGVYKLGDFGIARELESLSVSMSQKGTYGYIAPEVLNGVTYDSTVDIYSLGIVMYRLLNNNRLPFLDPNKQLLGISERREATEKRLNGEDLPAPLNGGETLGKIILKACSFDPVQRYENAEQMKADLIACREGKTVNVSIRPKPGKKARTSKMFLAAGGVLLCLALLTAGGLFAWSSYEKARIEGEKEKLYNQSVTALNQAKYDVAMYGFLNLEDYKDSAELLSECMYRKACDLENKNYLHDAYTSFAEIKDYKDSGERLLKCALYCGADCFVEGDYDRAEEYLKEVIYDMDYFTGKFEEAGYEYGDHSYTAEDGKTVPYCGEAVSRQIDAFEGIDGMWFYWFFTDDDDQPDYSEIQLSIDVSDINWIVLDSDCKIISPYPQPEYSNMKDYYDTYSK